jgi:hypothetical protein
MKRAAVAYLIKAKTANRTANVEPREAEPNGTERDAPPGLNLGTDPDDGR